MSDNSVRVRYAPSPTGLQHIGGVRTALFNYLFARNSGGRFILRLEDTDRVRSKDHYIQDLHKSLSWLGLQVDEGPAEMGLSGGDYGPYVQSQRLALYQKYARQLWQEGKAYYCFCSTSRLEQLRRQQEQNKAPQQGYDRHCRELTHSQTQARRSAGESCVLRFALPLAGVTTFCDLLLGDIERANSDINPDPIILKADGFPTYHLANVVDDYLMQISHVLRAQEWLSSGPLHVLLYRALGWSPPQFCHLPMVMGRDGAKLSKRHGATALLEFRKAGYLPQAIVNYVALLGWAFDDKHEFFTLPELEQCFDLAKLSRASATFDYQKLDWFNGQYIRKFSLADLQGELTDVWSRCLPAVYGTPQNCWQNFANNSAAELSWILPLLQDRLKTLNEAPALAAYFFARPDYLQPTLAVPKKYSVAEALALLQRGRAVLQQLCATVWEWQDFAGILAVKRHWEEEFRAAATASGVKLGPLLQPLRYAVSGSNVSPPLFESLIILQRLVGVEELLARLEQVEQQLTQLLDTPQ